jgi:hypothetical protein
MKCLTRYIVMCLLVLALPVQGFAASTMLLCGGGHHNAVQASAGGHDHAAHMHQVADSASDMAGSHAHNHVSQDAANQDAANEEVHVAAGHASQTTPDQDQSSVNSQAAVHAKVTGKCSACSACCAVAVLPASVIAFSAPAPSRALPVVELTTHVGFFTDGPDRPPRLHLA